MMMVRKIYESRKVRTNNTIIQVMKQAPHTFAERDFSSASQQLRESLLTGSKDVSAAKVKLKVALHALDEDGDGSVTTEELRGYILSHGVYYDRTQSQS